MKNIFTNWRADINNKKPCLEKEVETHHYHYTNVVPVFMDTDEVTVYEATFKREEEIDPRVDFSKHIYKWYLSANVAFADGATDVRPRKGYLSKDKKYVWFSRVEITNNEQ